MSDNKTELFQSNGEVSIRYRSSYAHAHLNCGDAARVQKAVRKTLNGAHLIHAGSVEPSFFSFHDKTETYHYNTSKGFKQVILVPWRVQEENWIGLFGDYTLFRDNRFAIEISKQMKSNMVSCRMLESEKSLGYRFFARKGKVYGSAVCENGKVKDSFSDEDDTIDIEVFGEKVTAHLNEGMRYLTSEELRFPLLDFAVILAVDGITIHHLNAKTSFKDLGVSISSPIHLVFKPKDSWLRKAPKFRI